MATLLELRFWELVDRQGRGMLADFSLIGLNVANAPPASHLKFSSQPKDGFLAIIHKEGSRVSSGELDLNSWKMSVGTWQISLGVAGLKHQDQFLAKLKRGQWFRLHGPFNVPIKTGALRNVQWDGRNLLLQFSDLLGSLYSRLTFTGADLRLFGPMAQTQVAGLGGYTPGDTELEVSATGGFERSATHAGCVKVQGNTGEFYLTYTGTAAAPARFTGVSAVGQFGTTANQAAIGNDVTEVAYMRGHPIQVAQRVLLSDGRQLGSPYDLPELWSYGLPSSLVSSSPWPATLNPASGSLDWDVLAEEEQQDGGAWVADLLAQNGCFAVSVMGRLEFRGSLKFEDIQISPLLPRLGANDFAKASDGSPRFTFEMYDSRQPIEYERARIFTPDGNSSQGTDPLVTQPGVRDYDLFPSHIYENQAAWRVRIRGGVGRYAVFPRLRWEGTVAGLRAARLVPGDWIALDMPGEIGAALRTITGFEQSEVRTLITRVSPQWFGASVDLAGVILIQRST